MKLDRARKILLGGALGIMMLGALAVSRLGAVQELGKPGVKVDAILEADRIDIGFPDEVLGCQWLPFEPTELEVNSLPKDTSFGKRLHRAEDGFQTWISVVVMGRDRTSIHRPQYCLPGQGWKIESNTKVKIPMQQPLPYDLEVNRIVASKEIQGRLYHSLFVYWFVEGNTVTSNDYSRMLLMAKELLKSGTLQRWAYISYFSVCLPGEEEATFQRMEEVIQSSVPEFQTAVGKTSTHQAGIQ